MKTVKFLAVLSAAAMVFACAPKANVTDVEADALESIENAKPVSLNKLLPSKGLTDSTSYLIGLNFGYFIKMNNFGDKLNYTMIRKGMRDFMNAEGNPQSPEFSKSLRIGLEEMDQVFSAFLQKRSEYIAEKNLRDGEKFLERNKKKAGVNVTESGLQYKVITEGEGAPIAENDTLQVYYKGTFVDGEQFDAREEGQDGEVVEPFEFGLHGGYRGVIQGWVEGLQLVNEGSEVELYIPSDLAYGKQAYNMEPNKTLIFNIKVVKVKKFVAPVEEETEE